MHKVQINDRLYKEAQRRARETGFASVDEFVADQPERNFADDQENFDDRFTPEVLTRLDQISADMQAGKKISEEKIDGHLADVRKEWRKNHPS